MKYYYDIWTLSEEFGFDGKTLSSAIRATFRRRRTDLPLDVPMGLSDDFAADSQKQRQWQGFLSGAAVWPFPNPISPLSFERSRFSLSPRSRRSAEKSGLIGSGLKEVLGARTRQTDESKQIWRLLSGQLADSAA